MWICLVIASVAWNLAGAYFAGYSALLVIPFAVMGLVAIISLFCSTDVLIQTDVTKRTRSACVVLTRVRSRDAVPVAGNSARAVPRKSTRLGSRDATRPCLRFNAQRDCQSELSGAAAPRLRVGGAARKQRHRHRLEVTLAHARMLCEAR